MQPVFPPATVEGGLSFFCHVDKARPFLYFYPNHWNTLMRYVLLLLTILTAGFSVWYYQNRISPEGRELAARKTAMEQNAVALEKTVSETRKKLDETQDATRTAEEAVEKFQQAYLDQKRQEQQEALDAAYRKSIADQQEEVAEHNQKIDQLRLRMNRQKENSKSAREELLQKRESMKTLLAKLADKQRSLQTELGQAERELSKNREDAKAKKKFSGAAPQKENIAGLQAQMNRIRAATAAINKKMCLLDAALEAQEENAGKQELQMQKAEEKLTEEKNKALAADDQEENTPPDMGDEELLAAAGYREQSKPVREALEKARKEEEQASRAYDEARAELRHSSRDEVKKLEKEEKDQASFRKLFTGGASVAGFLLLLFTVGAFRRSNG